MATDWAKLATQSNTKSTFTPPAKQDQGALTNAIEKTGAYEPLVVGGLLRDVTQPINTLLETGAEDISALGHKLSGDKTPYQTKFISPDEKKALTVPNANPLTAVQAGAKYEASQFPGQVGSILTAEGLSSLPKAAMRLPAIIKGIPGSIKMLTPKGAGKAIEEAHTAATKNGVTDTMRDVLAEMKQAVEDKFAPRGLGTADQALQASFGNMVKHVTGISYSPKTLSKMNDFKTLTGDLTPSDLVKARQTIMDRFGYNPENGNLDQKVANVVRDVLTKRAKDLTPGLDKADQAFVRSQQLKKMLPAIAKKIGIPAAEAGIGYSIFSALNGNKNDNGAQEPNP